MMYYKCRKQTKLVDIVPGLTDKHIRLLENTVYKTFRDEIVPWLPVTMFKKYFSADEGCPTKDLQSILGLFIIQAVQNLSDAEAVEAYCFNKAYHYALDIPLDSYLSMRAYYYYRLILLGEGHNVFGRVLKRIMERLDFEHSIQRKDSTLVQTNLKRMSRLELFTSTIRKFLKELKKQHPIIFSRISEELRERYLPTKEGESWFAGDKPSQYAERLIEAARDVLWLIERFGDHGQVSALESFGLLQRLAREQIQVEGDKVEVKLDEHCRGSAMVNPHDPEARYDGHREQVGYQLQLTESCSETKDVDHPKIITQIEVELANTSDVRSVVEGVEKLDAAGLKPEILLTDNGYAGDENHQQLQDNGVDQICPWPARRRMDLASSILPSTRRGKRSSNARSASPATRTMSMKNERKQNFTSKLKGAAPARTATRAR